MSTHKDDDEVENSPEAGEVSPEAEGGPLEQHLDDEQDAKGEVGPVENCLEQRVVVEVDVLEAQGDARREDHHEHDPLKGGRVDHLEHTLAHKEPSLAHVRLVQRIAAVRPAERSVRLDSERSAKVHTQQHTQSRCYGHCKSGVNAVAGECVCATHIWK